MFCFKIMFKLCYKYNSHHFTLHDFHIIAMTHQCIQRICDQLVHRKLMAGLYCAKSQKW